MKLYLNDKKTSVDPQPLNDILWGLKGLCTSWAFQTGILMEILKNSTWVPWSSDISKVTRLEFGSKFLKNFKIILWPSDSGHSYFSDRNYRIREEFSGHQILWSEYWLLFGWAFQTGILIEIFEEFHGHLIANSWSILMTTGQLPRPPGICLAQPQDFQKVWNFKFDFIFKHLAITNGFDSYAQNFYDLKTRLNLFKISNRILKF